MASTSSSKKSCYDVFINHHGKDVKRTLASSIYNMLDLMGVQAFLDQEELELGDFFPQAIEEAIHSASVHIAIFSPRYAESSWCLEELFWMLQTNVTIIPVFYGVEPSDLRHVEHGTYAGAFNQHCDKGRYSLEKIEKWKKALGIASNLTGRILDGGDNCDEGKLLREIVDAALHKMKKVSLEVATFPVGLQEAVQDFERKVGSSTGSEDMHIVGIVGMGGSGKTTLAKELYNRNCSSFSRSSFLSDVRYAASTNTLHKLQEKLLKGLRIHHPEFDNKDEGMTVLARGFRSMSRMSVVIVLDDVDHVDQIEALLPREVMHKLGKGTFIIITTREKVVLKSCGISSVYHMKLLDPFNARRLFCRHAFLQPYSQPPLEHPDENSHDFKDLIKKFVKACNGLPLSLKVVGAMVNGQSKDYWEDQLLHFSRILPEKIAERLRLSYDALDPDVQQMFLDVACFFIGAKKSLVIAIWYGSGWRGEIGWETLVNKCLFGLDEDGNIDMHDSLRHLGRQIARDVSPHRIWKENHISSIQEQISFQGVRPLIRGIVVGLSWRYYDGLGYYDSSSPPPLKHFMENIMKGPSLPGLQLLFVKGNYFRERFAALSRDLVWLRWHDFNGTNLPSWLSLTNLRVLELYNPKKLQELWYDNVQPPLQLRELIIDVSTNNCFRGLPRSIGRLRYLKKIVLNGNGSKMRSLPEEFCHLKSLEILVLGGFPVLSSLPHDFGKLINLRSLKLWTKQLTTLPDSFKRLTALQSLSIYSLSLMFPSEMLEVLESMTELQVLNLQGCHQLEELPLLTPQVSLRELDLRESGLRELPNNICQLTQLETLRIGGDNLTNLPESLGALSSLTYLEICGHNLPSLPESIGALSCLTYLEICGHMLTSLPESLGGLSCLTYLHISGDNLRSLPESLGALCCLTDLQIQGNNLTSLPESLGELLCLTNLNIRNCEMLEPLPEALGRLSNLKSLSIIWTPVEEIGMGIGSPSGCNLKSLKSLWLVGTRVSRISISHDCCPNLETLCLFHNNNLTQIETLPRNVREITGM